jgi:hypothetical protein
MPSGADYVFSGFDRPGVCVPCRCRLYMHVSTRIRERMTFEDGREIALIGIRLLEDAHLAWEAAEFEADQSLRAWSNDGSPAAYQAYRAALDREEAAARDLERLHELIQVCSDTLVAVE